jgi:hypothetical protein
MKKVSIIIAVLLLGTAGMAQSLTQTFQRNLDFAVGGYYQSWKTADNQKVSQFTVPVSFIVPVDRQLTLSVGTNMASSKYGVGSESNTLSGLTDSRIAAAYVGMDDHLLITGGVTAPTGKTKLNSDEAVIAGNIGLYPFAFRVPSYGQGTSANVAGSYAFEVEKLVLGFGASFVYKSGFIPYKNNDQKYVPGSEIAVNAGGERNVSFGDVDGKITLDVAYTLYGKDKYGDKQVFKSGNKLNADLRLLLNTEKNHYVIYLLERTKGKNEVGYGNLEEEDKNSNGNQIDLGGVGLFSMSDKFLLKGVLEGKYYSKNQSEENGAIIGGVGAGAIYMLTDKIALDFLAKVLKGTLKNKVSTDITGTDIGLTIRYRIQ